MKNRLVPHVAKELVEVPPPQITEEIMEVIHVVPSATDHGEIAKVIQHVRITELIVTIPVPQIMGK